MKSSAASVKSLQSVETSLSRIEVLLSSAGSDSRLQNHTSTRRHRRRATGDFDRRARGSSAGSAISRAYSSASAKSLPAVPLVPKARLPTPHVEPVERSLQVLKRQSSSEVVRNGWYSWTDLDEDLDEGDQEIDQGSTTVAYRTPTPELNPQACGRLLEGHPSKSNSQIDPWVTRDLLAKRYSTDVLSYISLLQDIQVHENRTSLLNLILDLNVGFTVEERLKPVVKERNIHQDCLDRLHAEVVPCRKRCILAGHSLHEIDSRLRPRSNISYLAQHSADQFYDSALTSISACDVPCPAGNVGASVYGEWSNKRDRINHWLLHCLQCDHGQGQLHRSMLADPLGDEREWASQSFLHWYSDEAATGDESYASPSSGAVDGGELWCQELSDAAEETNNRNNPKSYKAPRR